MWLSQGCVKESEELHWSHLYCECDKSKNSMNRLKLHAQMNVTWENWASLIERACVCAHVMSICCGFSKKRYWFLPPSTLNHLILGRQVWHSEMTMCLTLFSILLQNFLFKVLAYSHLHALSISDPRFWLFQRTS